MTISVFGILGHAAEYILHFILKYELSMHFSPCFVLVMFLENIITLTLKQFLGPGFCIVDCVCS